MAQTGGSSEPKVRALDDLDCVSDTQGPPSIESHCPVVSADFGYTTNCPKYGDRAGYEGKFAKELEGIQEMDDIIEQGDKFVSTLYTYRSVSKALPMTNVDLHDETYKLDVYKQEFELLRPEIIKLRDLMEFHDEAIRIFVSNMRTYLQAKKGVLSQDHMIFLIKIIDMLTKLNAIKDMKASLLNDFARYKRSFQPIRGQLSDSDTISEEIVNLQMFLGNLNVILVHLREDIQKAPQYEDYLVVLMNRCCEDIEKKNYVLPDEKHSLFRVLLQLIYLADSADTKGFNVFKNKKFNLKDRVKKLLSRMPVIPLYADMQINIQFVLQKCKHADKKLINDWVVTREKSQAQYMLINRREVIRHEYQVYTSQFVSLTNEIKGVLNDDKMRSDKDTMSTLAKSTFATVVDGYKLLSGWSGAVREQAAWKYCYGVSDAEYQKFKEEEDQKMDKEDLDEADEKLKELQDNSQEYAKVIRLNYSDKDLYALVEVLGMIKGLGGIMSKAENLVTKLLKRQIHEYTQEFVQNDVARPLRKAHKRKRNEIKETMLKMREFAADWREGKDNTNDYLSPKKVLVKIDRDIPSRPVPPSLTQVLLLRRMMHTIFDDNNPGMKGGVFSDKDLKSDWLEDWKRFYGRSFYFKYLIDYQKVLKELCDMSFLWYREFYLELTKCIQFPIEMSLPWILTDFVLRTPSLIANIFFPVDIWNDCAERSVSDLEQQFLFDEVEAEVNLAFDQLIFNVAKQMFIYSKHCASQLLLDKPYKTAIESLIKNKRGNYSLDTQNKRFFTLMAQHHIQIMGRSVDFKALVSEHVNGYLRTNLDYALSIFEARDLTAICELDILIQQIKLTHAILAQQLNIDSFEDMWQEINESVTLGAFRGRVVIQVLRELSSDMFRNFCYNSYTRRFVRGRETFVEKPSRASEPKHMQSYYLYGNRYNKAYENAINLTRGFFGIPHIHSLLNLLDPGVLPLVLDECISNIENQVNFVLQPYITAILSAIVPMKPPGILYGVVGAFTFYQLKLKPIDKYEPLRWGVYQTLREIGNSFAFVQLMELGMKESDYFETQFVSFFRAKHPTPAKVREVEEKEESKSEVSEHDKEGASPFVTIVENAVREIQDKNFIKHSDPATALVQNAREVDQMYSERTETSFFTAAIHRLALTMHQNGLTEEWAGVMPANGVIDIESPRDFCRMWSVLQFVFLEQSDQEMAGKAVTDPENFGDGLAWAGCTILHILNQKNRFEMLDFSYYLLKLQELDDLAKEKEKAFGQPKKKKKKKKGEIDPEEVLAKQLAVFIFGAKWMHDLNSFIFSELEAHWDLSSRPIQIFHPSGKACEWKENVYEQPLVNV